VSFTFFSNFSLSSSFIDACIPLSCVQDVHEIKFGADWQDALNVAVSNCEVFVPLVTPHYGETLWTNREVCHNLNTIVD